MERRFIVDLARFHRRDKGIYVLQGYFEGNSIAGSRFEAFLGSEQLPVESTVREGLTVRRKYAAMGQGFEDIDREYDLWIHLPEEYEKKRSRYLKVYQHLDGHRRCVFRRSVRALISQKKEPDYALLTLHADGQSVSIGGWAAGNSPCRIQVLDVSGMKIRSSIHWFYRQDIVDTYAETERSGEAAELKLGFEVRFDKPRRSRISLIIAADGQKKTCRIRLDRGAAALQRAARSPLSRLGRYYRRHGLRRTWRHLWERAASVLAGAPENEYMAWRSAMLPGREELRAQSRNVFLQQPLITVIVPLFRMPENSLRELTASMQHQTYANWQLLLADGSGEREMSDMLAELARADRRIRVCSAEMPLGVSENINHALEEAEGGYILLADPDDLLPVFSLYEFVRRINEEPEADLIYADEDKVGPDGKTFFDPHFKSDFNIDLLCSMNYFGRSMLVRRDLLEKAGGMDSRFDGAQDYDFALRCAEQAQHICHIPKVLYHRRCIPGEQDSAQISAFVCEQGRAAVQAHYDRIGIAAQVCLGAYPGLYRTIYEIPDRPPRISVVIPNRDHTTELRSCLASILEKTSYPDLEFIIVENGSTAEETFVLYEQLMNAFPNIHVVTWDGAFNYADINNYALNTATGEYLLFLNNDTAMIGERTIEELLGPCLRSDVGVVGGRLYYEDNTIQHAGVIIGSGGSADHAFRGRPRSEAGYQYRIIAQSDLSAVTGACMMVKRSLFEQLGGFDSTLQITYSDIDFCLRARQSGALVVYNPYAEMYHYEGRTRNTENTPEQVSRLTGEADEFLKRWPDILKNGDPYYNPNLSLDTCDFSLKRI